MPAASADNDADMEDSDSSSDEDDDEDESNDASKPILQARFYFTLFLIKITLG